MGIDPTPADSIVDVQLAWQGAVPPAADLRCWAAAALAGGPGTAREVCIRVVDEDESRALNLQFRSVPRPTNVLSFPADMPGFLGDIAICGPVVIRESEAQGKLAAEHFAHLVVHGVLHLLGMDHEIDAEAEVMESREIEILKGVGVANPYEP